MKLWAKCLLDQRIQKDTVGEFMIESQPTDAETWEEILDGLCKPLDLARPVLMKKHIRELLQFRRTVFYPADFMESVDFDRLEIEIFPERKKDRY